MTITLERPAVDLGTGDGGMPARRAVVRWAWRLFRREWRQQLLVLALIVVAVAATFVGATVATNTPPPANAGFGSAQDQATFQGSPAQLGRDIAQVQQRFHQIDVIENQTLSIPGSIGTYDLRAQNPRGPFGQPMLSLVSGQYPVGAGQVALTGGVASSLNLKVGDIWHQAGQFRRIVGIVENPQSLLDEFALVAPGQVAQPTQATVLFDAHGVDVVALGPNFQSVGGAAPSNGLNPETIVLALATLGMLLIALVAIGGFTVLAQRRLRSIGMLGSLGATDDNISLVVRANGLVVGVVGTLLGVLLGMAVWLAYRPHVESSAHHLIGVFALPWTVIGASMVLAIVATFFAASRPARAITRVPIVAALSGRPPAPKAVHRSAVPGVVALGVAFLLLSSAGAGNGGDAGALIFGLVALIVAVVLLSPLGLAVLARLARRGPIAVRLAVRDLARYRSRSGSALAAISLGVLIAVIICLISAARYGNVLDYAGPNLTSNQINVYTPNAPQGGGGPVASTAGSSPKSIAQTVDGIAAALGTRDVVELESTSATLQHAAGGRQFSGQVYVATPALLEAFGITASQVDPDADVLTMRPGLSGISEMQLVYGNYFGSDGNGPGKGSGSAFPCPADECLANPSIQEVRALPAGTSAPNTVITEHAVHQLGLHVSTAGWLLQTAQPLTASQITNARLTAAAGGLTVETKNDQPTSS